MDGKQVACPECGSVSTLDRCWIGMEHECDNCHHVFKIAARDICLDLDETAASVNSASAAVPVSFTCRICGSKQQATVKSGESMVRCAICSSMTDAGISRHEVMPVHNTAPGVIVQNSAVRQYSVQNSASLPIESRRRGSALKVTMLALLAVAVLFGGICGAFYFLNNLKSHRGSADGSSGSASGSNPGEKSGDLPGKIKRVDQSVVCIVVRGNDGQEWVGTGFAVTPQYIITNRHVAKGAQNSKVMIGNPKWEKQLTTATVREISQTYDLAWLELDDKSISLKPMILQERVLDQGDKVYTLGYPGYSYKQSNAIPQLTVADGIIKSNDRIMDSNPCYESSATINGGNSGGPLVNENFQVVGVNTFKMKAEYAEGCFYSIRVEVLKSAFPELWKEIKGE